MYKAGSISRKKHGLSEIRHQPLPLKKHYFSGQLVFKRLVTEYIPRCFLCLDYLYLHEFGETWPRAHDQGEIYGVVDIPKDSRFFAAFGVKDRNDL